MVFASLFTNEMSDDAARVRHGTMFPKINSLPCAERHFSADDWNAEIDRSQRGADVSGHIIITLTGMAENRIAIGNEPRKKSFEIAAHFRVGIFLNDERRRSVLKMKCQQAGLDIRFCNKVGGIVRELVKAAPTIFDYNFIGSLPEHSFFA